MILYFSNRKIDPLIYIYIFYKTKIILYLHNFLENTKRMTKYFTEYKHEDMATNDIHQQMTQ